MVDGDGWVQQLDSDSGHPGVRVGQVWEGVGPGRPGRKVYVARLYDPAQAVTPECDLPMAFLQSVVASPSGRAWLHAGNRPPMRVARLVREYRLRDNSSASPPGHSE